MEAGFTSEQPSLQWAQGFNILALGRPLPTPRRRECHARGEGDAVISLCLALGFPEPCCQCRHPDSLDRVGLSCRHKASRASEIETDSCEETGPLHSILPAAPGAWGGSTH